MVTHAPLYQTTGNHALVLATSLIDQTLIAGMKRWHRQSAWCVAVVQTMLILPDNDIPLLK